MNRMKKFASIMLALVMAFALMAPAFASTNATGSTGKITIEKASKGHKYDAYQIFSGTLSYDSSTETDLGGATLSNIQWGTGVNQSALATALANTTFKDVAKDNGVPIASAVAEMLTKDAEGKDLDATTKETRARELAQAIGKTEGGALGSVTGTATAPTGEGDVNCVIDAVPYGYYLIKDSETELDNDKNGFISLFMLQVVGPTTVTAKGEAPTVKKEVADVNDSESTTDSAPTETWGDSADHDIGDMVKFKLTATLPSNYADYTKKYTLVFHDTLSAGLTYQGDAKVYYVTGEGDSATKQEITTGVTITPNAAATAGGGELTITIDDLKTAYPSAAASGKIVVEYTAELNDQAQVRNENKVYLEYSNNPNSDGDGDKGKTPEDIVVVFTFTTTLDKIDPNKEGDDKSLAGAGFTLYKYDPKQYATETDATKKGENGWIVVEVIDAADGKTSFEFKGLDDGRYKLVESTVPAGYNKMEDIYFVIEATHDTPSDDPQLTKLVAYKSDAEGNVNEADKAETGKPWIVGTTTDGILDTDIENNKGATLPETGGIGTTIFYALGGLLTVGAVVLLVTKKRMSAGDK